MVQHKALRIHKGAVFRAVGWVVCDDDGQPVRSTAGVDVVAKVRLHPDAPDVLHEFAASAQLVVFPGQYGDQPVVVAQIDEMGPDQTAGLGWSRGQWDMLVSGELIARGPVSAAPVVSR